VQGRGRGIINPLQISDHHRWMWISPLPNSRGWVWAWQGQVTGGYCALPGPKIMSDPWPLNMQQPHWLGEVIVRSQSLGDSMSKYCRLLSEAVPVSGWILWSDWPQSQRNILLHNCSLNPASKQNNHFAGSPKWISIIGDYFAICCLDQRQKEVWTSGWIGPQQQRYFWGVAA
jgi:hypothetical protein